LFFVSVLSDAVPTADLNVITEKQKSISIEIAHWFMQQGRFDKISMIAKK
jgi:hypothetical protein